MATDVSARLQINSIKAQLGGQAASNIIGRYARNDLDFGQTTLVTTWDTTNQYRVGVVGKNVIGSTNPQLHIGHDPTSQTWLRVINKDDEFRFFTEKILSGFTESSLTTANVVASANTVAFDAAEILVTKAVFLNDSNTYSRVLLTAAGLSGSINYISYYVSPNRSTWQLITPGTLTTLTSPTSTLYVKMLAASACTVTFLDSNGEGSPLKIKMVI